MGDQQACSKQTVTAPMDSDASAATRCSSASCDGINGGCDAPQAELGVRDTVVTGNAERDPVRVALDRALESAGLPSHAASLTKAEGEPGAGAASAIEPAVSTDPADPVRAALDRALEAAGLP